MALPARPESFHHDAHGETRFASPWVCRRHSVETVSNLLPLAVRWDIAVRTKTPAHVARTFANQVGAFYDREEFDALARQVSDLYSQESPENARHFRARLDRR